MRNTRMFLRIRAYAYLRMRMCICICAYTLHAHMLISMYELAYCFFFSLQFIVLSMACYFFFQKSPIYAKQKWRNNFFVDLTGACRNIVYLARKLINVCSASLIYAKQNQRYDFFATDPCRFNRHFTNKTPSVFRKTKSLSCKKVNKCLWRII